MHRYSGCTDEGQRRLSSRDRDPTPRNAHRPETGRRHPGVRHPCPPASDRLISSIDATDLVETIYAKPLRTTRNLRFITIGRTGAPPTCPSRERRPDGFLRERVRSLSRKNAPQRMKRLRSVLWARSPSAALTAAPSTVISSPDLSGAEKEMSSRMRSSTVCKRRAPMFSTVAFT